MKKEELIENVIIWYRNNVPMMSTKSAKELTKEYLSINSTRRSERRADGSNSKAKEVCPKTGFCNIAEQYGFCPYQCALFNREQTD